MHVYSKVSGTVRWSQGTTVLGQGMSADHDHPLVLERPDLFTTDGPPAQLQTPRGAAAAPAEPEPPVERATRAPGEKRGQSRKVGPANG